ncbi:MAG: hypothetical protein U0900_08200 [Myxococcota bacterium]
MPHPLPPPTGPDARIAAHARGAAGDTSAASALLRRLGLVLFVVPALALGGCVRPDDFSFSPESLDRDRAAREEVLADIDRDHATLAALIASDRFEQPETIYTDPELRAVALHLVEQARKLRRLAESDVLAPGAP